MKKSELKQIIKEEISKILNEGYIFNSKEISLGSIELEDVFERDRPDFVDAYISYAEYTDGTPLTDEELEQLANDYSLSGDIIQDVIMDRGY